WRPTAASTTPSVCSALLATRRMECVFIDSLRDGIGTTSMQIAKVNAKFAFLIGPPCAESSNEEFSAIKQIELRRSPAECLRGGADPRFQRRWMCKPLTHQTASIHTYTRQKCAW